MALSLPDKPAWAIDAAPAAVSARFFGFEPDNNAPNPSDLPAVKRSMAAIHFGIGGSTPFMGRACHCLTATASSTRPKTSLITSTAVEVSSLVSAPPASSSTSTLTTTSPTTQPTANAGPFERARGVPSIRITAMIGTGLRATPMADGSWSPIAWASDHPAGQAGPEVGRAQPQQLAVRIDLIVIAEA
jgi:hypothetical protein